MIYLDNASTTKVAPEVYQAMKPYLKKEYGNPSSKYYSLAKSSENAVSVARRKLASLLKCEEDEIIFTSGATESNNFIIKGIANAKKQEGQHIITTAIEHKSVLETCRYMESKGWKVSYLEPDENGRIKASKLEKAIDDNTVLISIMWANNELGSLNNIDQFAEIAEEHDIFFHTDATQIIGKKEISLSELGVNAISLSAHKIHGPKGIGGVYLSNDDLGFKPDIEPLMHGGNQEYGLRGGTLSVHNIVGFGKAAELYEQSFKESVKKINELENQLREKLEQEFDQIIFNDGNIDQKIPGIVSIMIPGTNNEFILSQLDNDIAISTGSACSIGEPSHVLKNIGLKEEAIVSSYRISISKYNDAKEIDSFVDSFSRLVKKYID